uniref:protein-tyrosine-phosphatase n=1 Tax=Eptatretus burgeri TaxID=7764 RepID=A0A8C4R924_EPTBU
MRAGHSKTTKFRRSTMRPSLGSVLLLLLQAALPSSGVAADKSKSAGMCVIEGIFPKCAFSQDLNDHMDWEVKDLQQLEAIPGLGRPSGAFAMVASSQGLPVGRVARLSLPTAAKNDTHCISFSFRKLAPNDAQQPTLRLYVRVNGGPLGRAVWNAVDGVAANTWKRAELAVSVFWPNEYLVVFEAEFGDKAKAFLAIADILSHQHPCVDIPHFLPLLSTEVNAGQNATFQCVLAGNGEPENIFLQGQKGVGIPAPASMGKGRRITATFSVPTGGQPRGERLRCVAHSTAGATLSNFASLIVREPPSPVAPPLLVRVAPTTLWLDLNANSIRGEGPVMRRELLWKATTGTWTEVERVDGPTYKLWHLDPDTAYEMRVLLSRPGSGGTGPPGPPLLTRTRCAEPWHGPQNVRILTTRARELGLRWDPLGYNVTRCHAYNVTVCYNSSRLGSDPSSNSTTETCCDAGRALQGYTLTKLPPFHQLSVRAVLATPEGRKASLSVSAQTKEDVPGPISVENIMWEGTDETILLKWLQPEEPNGILTQYKVSYNAVRSGDPNFRHEEAQGTVFKAINQTQHLFSGLFPGTTYSITVCASTARGYGQATTVRLTTQISAPSFPQVDADALLDYTETTATVLLRPARGRGASVSSYRLVVSMEAVRKARALTQCQETTAAFQQLSPNVGGLYVAAALPGDSLSTERPFTVGDNRTYGGFWNAPLAATKIYTIYLQAFCHHGEEKKVSCVKLAKRGARNTIEPDAENVPSAELQTDHTMRAAGVIAGILAVLILVMGAVLYIKKRKLAKKRKGNMERTRQEMTQMVNTMDKSYPDPNGTLVDEPSNLVDTQNITLQSYCSSPTNTIQTHSTLRRPNQPYFIQDDGSPSILTEPGLVLTLGSHSGSGTGSGGTVHGAQGACGGGNNGGGGNGASSGGVGACGPTRPAVRVADLLQHITQMKTTEGCGFKEEYENVLDGQSASWQAAKKEVNRNKNRYANVVAYDHSRVILQPVDGSSNSDYINASYIDGYQKPRQYIATQGPIQETVFDFWRMIWQEKSASIVMVTNLVEVGRVKCFKYWPEDVSVYGDITVTLTHTELLAEYVIRTFSVKQKGCFEIHEVRQLHFTGWPDHGVPYHSTGLLAFIHRVKTLNPTDAGPVVVHCSAGAGRTGCFIVIDIMLEMAEHEGVVDVYNCIRELRLQRINMVQTEEQYVFIHDVLLEACLCGDTAYAADTFRSTYHELGRVDPLTHCSRVKEEFLTLTTVTAALRPDDCSIALLPRNSTKNRQQEALPPDRCLPFLLTLDGDSSNYINAALMDSYHQPSAFIVTQHPLPNTVKDFWRLVFDYCCSSVIMLNELSPVESCPQYWPEEGLLQYGAVQVEILSSAREGDVVSRVFRIRNVSRPHEGHREVQHFQYLAWPAHREVPASPLSFLRLVARVRRWHSELASSQGRTLVHCLNGGGRAGVYCAVSVLCDQIKNQSVIDVFTAVKTLRNSKPNMVESLDQYRFCYDAALEFVSQFQA